MPARSIEKLTRWLVQEGPALADTGELVAALAEELREAGVSVVRATSHVGTLHPRYRGITRLWKCGQGVREIPIEHGGPPRYEGSPLEHVRTTSRWLDVRLDRPPPVELEMFEELRAEGLTHYVMAPVPFSDGSIHGASWATDAMRGFSAEELGALREIVPFFSVVLELKALRRIDPELLAAYVGRGPAERILAGAIRRGSIRTIRAAMMLSDLRGFTSLASRESPEAVVEWLDGYFDIAVDSIEAEGGEVLKFIGDAVLAVFPERPDLTDPVPSSARALRSAERLARDARASTPRLAPYEPKIGLHVGTIAYGNVGSRERLDFTAIGHDVKDLRSASGGGARRGSALDQPPRQVGSGAAAPSSAPLWGRRRRMSGLRKRKAWMKRSCQPYLSRLARSTAATIASPGTSSARAANSHLPARTVSSGSRRRFSSHREREVRR